MSHHMELHETPPWLRREVARNTGHKCERGDRHLTQPLKAARRKALRAQDKKECSLVLGAVEVKTNP